MKTQYRTTTTLTPDELSALIREALGTPDAVVNFNVSEMSDWADRGYYYKFTSVDVITTK